MLKLIIGRRDPRALPLTEDQRIENGGKYYMGSPRESYKMLIDLERVSRVEIYMDADSKLSPSFLSRFHIVEKVGSKQSADVLGFVFKKISGMRDRYGWVFE